MNDQAAALRAFLLSKTSYQKVNASILADKFSLSREQVVAVQRELRGKPTVEPPKVEPEKSLKETLFEEFMAFMESKVYKESIYTPQKIQPKQYHLTRPGLYVVAGCFHFPFHHKEFFESFIAFLKDQPIEGLILNGDIFDMHSISRHNKGKIVVPGLTLSREYELSSVCFDRIDAALEGKSTEKHFTRGNHESWYSTHMKEVDNQKLGTGVVKSPEEGCRLYERGYKIQTDYNTAKVTIGDIEVIHGVYFNEHASKKHLDVMKRSVLFNHTHRISSYHSGAYSAYNIGWGGDKDQPVFSYKTSFEKENWRNGFATIHVDEQGISHVQQVEFIGGKIRFGNKIY